MQCDITAFCFYSFSCFKSTRTARSKQCFVDTPTLRECPHMQLVALLALKLRAAMHLDVEICHYVIARARAKVSKSKGQQQQEQRSAIHSSESCFLHFFCLLTNPSNYA